MLEPVEYIYSNPDGRLKNTENKIIPFINYNVPAPKRCLDMLLDKYHGRAYQSEVVMKSPKKRVIPALGRHLSESTIMLITDGGLVPRGNPDKIPSTNAEIFGIYDITGKNALESRDYEVSHQGYDNTSVKENPNRLVPVDAMRELEQEHVIGKLYDAFISTTGVMTSARGSISLGEKIADYVKSHEVDAVIITSACGTSTRCGAWIAIAVEKTGIPVVQVAHLAKIARDTGCSRVMQGRNIGYPFGSLGLSEENEYLYRKEQVQRALGLLCETPGKIEHIKYMYHN